MTEKANPLQAPHLWGAISEHGDNFSAWGRSEEGRKNIEATYLKRSFDAWLRHTTPDFNWDWLYLQVLKNALNRVTEGSLKRLMVFMPPRHGKSTMSTISYPVYRLYKDPKLRVIVGAYSQTLAEKFSRVSRRIAREHMALSDERTAVDDWETTEGGGLRAVGVGGGITGQGGELIIIDDPVKSRAEANSPAYRNGVWNWYTDDLYTRQEPGAAIVLIMTRWHEDDLAGRILDSEDGDNWEIIKFPALAEEDEPAFPLGLGRKTGDALCPDRYDVPVLLDRKRVLGSAFDALYQQNPTAQEGGFFKRHWFKIVRAIPASIKNIVRYWDLAASDDDGAYTVGLLMASLGGQFEGNYIILDVVRDQLSTAGRNRLMLQVAEMDKARYKGRVRTWFEREPGSSGIDAANAVVTYLSGHAVRAHLPSGSKVTRAGEVQAQAEVGNVFLLGSVWNQAFLDEYGTFPYGAYKDQVDAGSGAFNRLNVRKVLW